MIGLPRELRRSAVVAIAAACITVGVTACGGGEEPPGRFDPGSEPAEAPDRFDPFSDEEAE